MAFVTIRTSIDNYVVDYNVVDNFIYFKIVGLICDDLILNASKTETRNQASSITHAVQWILVKVYNEIIV